MDFYSAIKNNKITSFSGIWMELENIMLSEISQSQKVKGHLFSLIGEARSKIGSERNFSQMRRENNKRVGRV